ncbi:MAG TPA: MoaD/ThiS family protein [Aquabacterium sp.]|uniref:sulfur carrier protein ThiS n=1 Tax=Aquabacterium sp. TaxID=1872578 RepID=UPI002E31666F|nr:MoaD/ThiS family protein [Aquabacterium sp.]HEX5372823.1 MoaD/ThiS family protein [Aquabacterium sp.]
MPETITIQTDQGPLVLPVGSTVDQALARLQDPDATPLGAVATAVNGSFVSRHARSWHVLRDGDTLLCFTAITGG